MSAICRDTPVATFRAREGKDELARINRLTGLQFESVPRSLLRTPERPGQPEPRARRECVVMAFRESAAGLSR